MRWARSSSADASFVAVVSTFDVPSEALVCARPWAMPPATIARMTMPTRISMYENPACRDPLRELTRLFLSSCADAPPATVGNGVARVGHPSYRPTDHGA